MAENKATSPVEKKGKKLAVIPVQTAEVSAYEQQRQSVESMIASAIEKGTPVDTMERILAMRKELKSEWAKEQYDRAMAAFQAECPVIEKTKTARDEEKGKDLYSYAPLGVILSTKAESGERVSELIAKHGLSYSFKTVNSADRVKVSCFSKHISGHSEESIMETSLGNKTHIMSAPQQIAATVTFNKRYAFMNAFGIIVGDEDNEQKLLETDQSFETLVEDSKAKLAACTTQNDLKAVWSSLPKSIKGSQEMIVFANQLKKAYENPQDGAAE